MRAAIHRRSRTWSTRMRPCAAAEASTGWSSRRRTDVPPRKEILAAITAVLSLQSPLTAREIASMLASSGMSVDKSRVNKILYAGRSTFEHSDDVPPFWSLTGARDRGPKQPPAPPPVPPAPAGCRHSTCTRGSGVPSMAGHRTGIAASSRRSPVPARRASRSRRSPRRSLAAAALSRSCPRPTCRASGTGRSAGT